LNKEEVLEFYYANEASELKKVVNLTIKQVCPGIPTMYFDEFMSVANKVMFDIYQTYDPDKAEFRTFLISCLQKKFKSLLDKLNSKKNGGGEATISIDDENNSLEETLPGNSNTEREAIGGMCSDYSEKVERFINSLTKQSRIIAEDVANGLSRKEIQEIRNITNKQYENSIMEMRKFENAMILRNKTMY
jgi:DNA-directed RNA polymerase specialized sigma24 family protein